MRRVSKSIARHDRPPEDYVRVSAWHRVRRLSENELNAFRARIDALLNVEPIKPTPLQEP